ncbi:hypothetical protein [Symbioplanes lichenis]|uniref:hypothetical protein n=1 Tax=Symbioplanes lichenis TaxID=1629072 RepID=UPI00273A3919|nr:hypothetical protein [Actinoplanes lichenis]
MGASQWGYHVPYQPDLAKALRELKEQVLADGDYWWAVPGESGKRAAEFPQRPRTHEELWADDDVQEGGTHSILDMSHMIEPGDYDGPGTVEPVTADQALLATGTATPTRAHAEALTELAGERWFGRCAVLHDERGRPAELFFFGHSGD